jgi:hypothetical protein
MTVARALTVIIQIALVAAAPLLGACDCPPPGHVDQIFRLDAGADASAGGAASDADGGSGAGDCTAAASGCAPGDTCKPACDCVLARAHVAPVGKIEKCTLLAGPGPAQVEVRYEIPTFCGGN